MGYQPSKAAANDIFRQWAERYNIFAPRRMEGEGCFSDTDIIRYVKVGSLERTFHVRVESAGHSSKGYVLNMEKLPRF